MPGLLDQLFEVNFARTEGVFRFARSTTDRSLQFALAIHTPHSFAATPGRSLEQDRVADLACDLAGFFDCLNTLFRAGNDRSTNLQGDSPGARLRSHLFDRTPRGADKLDPCCRTGLSEARILAQKPIARMNCICSGGLGGFKDSGTDEVALSRRRRTDRDRLIRHLHMKSRTIDFRED